MSDTTGTSEKESVVVDQGKVTFSYSRKRNIGNYESEDVFVSSTHTVPTTLVDGFIDGQGEKHMQVLKVHVFEALGLTWELDPEGLAVVRATQMAPAIQVAPAPQPQAPMQQAPQPVAMAPAQQPPVSTISAQPTPAVPAGGMAAAGVYAPPPGACGDCGMNDWWDNRAEQDGKIALNQKIGPDFKCKNQQCKHSIFRPGSFQYNKQAGPRAPQAAIAQGVAAMAPPPAAAPAAPAYTEAPPVTAPWSGPADEAPF